MPKEGFKSITISDYNYERFKEAFQTNKQALARKGINSFSGYVTYMLEEAVERDRTFARCAPKLEALFVEEDRIVLQDNIHNRIAEVVLQQGEVFCLFCESKDCVHVGYVFSIPEVYRTLDNKGINKPDLP